MRSEGEAHHLYVGCQLVSAGGAGRVYISRRVKQRNGTSSLPLSTANIASMYAPSGTILESPAHRLHPPLHSKPPLGRGGGKEKRRNRAAAEEGRAGPE